jgi:hypothetical protein
MIEEIRGAYLAPFQDEFEAIEPGIGMSAAERAAGLDIGDPGEGVNSELLDCVRRGVTATDQDTADRRN